VGAHKCGTSSLYSILSEHPEVFMSRFKEPHFLTWQCWNKEVPGPGDDYIYRELVCKRKEDYLDMFSLSGGLSIRGEGSTDTLYYAKQSIPMIQDLLGDPRILVILRNPAERAFSAYKHLWRDGRESESFASGLELEGERIRNGYEYMWHYRKGGFYAENVRMFMSDFSRVKVVFFEDFIRDPESVVNGVLGFLGLGTHEGLSYARKQNTAGDPRIKWLRDLIRKPTKLRNTLKPFIPLKVRDWIRDDLMRLSSRPMKLEGLHYLQLMECYREDIKRLEDILSGKCPWPEKISP